MIKSMTGYASESFIINSTKFIVEIKSVNSKTLDLNIRCPHFLKSYENDLRKEISSKLFRGKIELNVTSEIGKNLDEISINQEIVSNYIKQLKELNNIDSKGKKLKHKLIKEVRGIGLMLCLIMRNIEITNKLVLEAKSKGLILFWLLIEKKAVRITPPLTISKKELEEGCDIILNILDSIE